MPDLLPGDDGLPISEIGEWFPDKHKRLARYIGICSATRRKYSHCTYIDLFSGPGRSRVRESGEIVDGSPVVAFKASDGCRFSEMHIADLDPDRVAAAAERIRRLGGTANVYVGTAEDTVRQIVDRLNPYGLHFAFLDPFALGPMPFSILRELSRVKRIDILIHVSAMDLQRNLPAWIKADSCALDAFAPDWRKHVDTTQRQDIVRQQVFQYWLSLVQGLGLDHSKAISRVTNSTNALLYWLILIAKHSLADKFWREVENVSPQAGFGF